MLTQKKLDEMRVKAAQEAQEKTDAWRLTFMGPRHPDNMPTQMTRPAPEMPLQPTQDEQGGLNG